MGVVSAPWCSHDSLEGQGQCIERSRSPTASLRERVAALLERRARAGLAELLRKDGGRQEARTPDLRVANAALSQLS